MFDRKDIENIGEEYEHGLRVGGTGLEDKQIKALRTAFEMGMMTALKMVENRVFDKDSMVKPVHM
jgi:hypothetical protein